MTPVQQNTETAKDESTVFSENWAALFRKLTSDQQMYANKAIIEVLYQGQLGQLGPYSFLKLMEKDQTMASGPFQQQNIQMPLSFTVAPAPSSFHNIFPQAHQSAPPVFIGIPDRSPSPPPTEDYKNITIENTNHHEI